MSASGRGNTASRSRRLTIPISDTLPSEGTDVCTSTMSGGRALASSAGTSDRRQGK
ncbi:MAG: hypothetical protein J2P26_10110 [Nocardiopsaceae bacterium]|nr:hypothetical protein [Nocardiopsaceae bacterium]